MSQMLHPSCVPPDVGVCFGSNLSHISKANARAFLDHWISAGFLEFKKVWRKGCLQDPLPADERWHMLRGDEEPANHPDVMFDEGVVDDEDPIDTHQASAARPSFGSKGPLLQLSPGDPLGFTEPIHGIILFSYPVVYSLKLILRDLQ